jgi:UPF0716 family protein affecting phage T7 exclusion
MMGGNVSKQIACNWLLSVIVISASFGKFLVRIASFRLKTNNKFHIFSVKITNSLFLEQYP